jgi:ATPase family associated with various cellular activities (AAA)
MTTVAEWQKSNEEYLAAALEWLRLRLARHAARGEAPVIVAPDDANAAAAPPPTPAVTDEQLAEAGAAMAALESAEPLPALAIAARRFGLSRFEQDVLLLCAAMELDPATASRCARAQHDPSRPYPTFALALWLFDEPAWDVLSPERPLRYWRLVDIHQAGGQPLTTSALRADERIVNYIKGLNHLDDRLAPLLVPIDTADGLALPPSQQSAVDTIAAEIRRTAGDARLPVVNLIGTDAPSKQLVAVRAADALALQLYRLPAELLPSQASELETLARLAQRESVLVPVALYVDAHDAERPGQGESHAPPVSRFLARMEGVVFLATRDVWPGLTRPALTVEAARPTSAEQRATWATATGRADSEMPARLAGQFDLDLAAIHRIAESAQGDETRLWAASVASARPRLDDLAQRLDVKATLDQLVAPPPEKRLLREIAEQVGHRSRVYDDMGFARRMNRGLGISTLFAGESGTGKTMAAEAIANALQLDLYRIDLSSVVSKYIGETPKNLRQLFDAAESGGAILFFDEADALFGKRSEVRDSHDRYANIEINYLLQRIEAYRGLAILATNLKASLDPAFVRRMRFIVNFRHPDARERREIWAKVFPPETRTAGLDLDRLARFDVTGGAIHNIALNAAFLAAGTEEGVVTMPLILDAARTEFRKMDRFVNEADFRWKEPEVRSA